MAVRPLTTPVRELAEREAWGRNHAVVVFFAEGWLSRALPIILR